MAFQTNVFREGEWVTETVNINDVIKGNAVLKGPKKTKLLKPPRCGILTRHYCRKPARQYHLASQAADRSSQRCGLHWSKVRSPVTFCFGQETVCVRDALNRAYPVIRDS